MKLLITNSSDRDIWTIVAQGQRGGTSVIYVEFFLTGDPSDNTLPDKVPNSPDGIVINIPREPDNYFVPEGYTFKANAAFGTTPDGQDGIKLDIQEVLPSSAVPTIQFT